MKSQELFAFPKVILYIPCSAPSESVISCSNSIHLRNQTRSPYLAMNIGEWIVLPGAVWTVD